MALSLSEYRDALRTFLKDSPELNRLLKFEKENTDPQLDLYLNMAIGFLNSIPPYIGPFSWENFPIPNLVIHQATIESLISNSIVQARNELTYNNGGVTLKVADGARYVTIIQLIYRATDQEISALKNIKIAINIQQGYGGVSSPYSYLHGRSAILNPNSILAG